MANLFLGALKDHVLTDKLQGITMDNAVANTKFMERLVELMNSLFGTHFDSNDLHFRSLVHIINLAAQNMLHDLEVIEAYYEEPEIRDDDYEES